MEKNEGKNAIKSRTEMLGELFKMFWYGVFFLILGVAPPIIHDITNLKGTVFIVVTAFVLITFIVGVGLIFIAIKRYRDIRERDGP